MKRLVNLVQLLIVVALLYPVYYVWDTSRIEHFCHLIEPGMSVKELMILAENEGISLNMSPDGETGQWMTSIDSRASIEGFACVIIGAVDKVANAKIVRHK